MKNYPSISQSIGQKFVEMPNAFVFDKIDGSSMRSEFSKKRGWFKHGKRQGLVDDSNPHLVQVPVLFEKTLAEPLAKLATDKKWQHLIVFYEFAGPKSFAGWHGEEDDFRLSLFDAAVDKKGIMGPDDYLRTFYDLGFSAAFLGRFNWTRGFVQNVFEGLVPGITFEGVVGKLGTRHDIVRAKAKTKAWLDKVRAVHGTRAEAIINS